MRSTSDGSELPVDSKLSGPFSDCCRCVMAADRFRSDSSAAVIGNGNEAGAPSSLTPFNSKSLGEIFRISESLEGCVSPRGLEDRVSSENKSYSYGQHSIQTDRTFSSFPLLTTRFSFGLTGATSSASSAFASLSLLDRDAVSVTSFSSCAYNSATWMLALDISAPCDRVSESASQLRNRIGVLPQSA